MQREDRRALDAAANPVAQTATVVYYPDATSVEQLRGWVEECGYHCAGQSAPGHVCDPLVSPDHGPHDHAAAERADEAHGHGHGGHAGMSMDAMARDMRNRFLVALAFTIPVVLWSNVGKNLLGSEVAAPFGLERDVWLLLLSLPIVFYSSTIFFTGAVAALRARTLDMMVLVAVAIGIGFTYSAAVTFGLSGETFYDAAAMLATFVLLGHWFEMRARRRQRRHPRAPRPRTAEGDRGSRRPAGRDPNGRGAGRRPVAGPPGIEDPRRRRGRRGRERGRRVRGDGREPARVQAARRPTRRRHDQQERHAARPHHRDRLGYRAGADRGPRAGGAELEGARPATGRPRRVLARARGARRGLAHLPHLGGRGRARRRGVAAVRDRRGGHHLPRRARAGHADGDHGRLGAGRRARHPVQERHRARAGGAPGHRRLRQDRHADPRRARGRGDRDRRPHQRARAARARRGRRGRLRASARRGDRQGRPRARARGAPRRRVRGRSRARRAGHRRRPPAGDRERAPHGREHVSLDGLAVRADELAGEGRTVVQVAIDAHAAGLIAIADAPRDTAADAVRALHGLGVRTVMLSGDSRPTAERIAREVGIDEVIAEVLPADKAARVAELQADGRKVAMVGDGVNDAPALAQAAVGIAIGTGTDVAVETADLVLMRSDPLDVATAITISRGTLRKMRQNLAWAVGYNSLAIPIAAGIFEPVGFTLSPEVGAISMSGSSVIVAVNAVALKRLRLPRS